LGEGYEIFVVVMTDGQHSHDHTFGIIDPSPVAIKKIRKEEFKEAMETLGVKEANSILLDFEDGKLAKNFTEAEEKIKSILSGILPAEIYVTCRDDQKEDHECAFKIVCAGLNQVGISSTIYEYPIWSRKRDVTQYNDKRIFVQDITDQVTRKKAAINKYKSQITIYSEKQRDPVLQESFVKMFLEKEVFFRSEQLH
jgi:LmbE family N-acetylglucosaminyl deacetylase